MDSSKTRSPLDWTVPVYVPSKGRVDKIKRDVIAAAGPDVTFLVEREERKDYEQAFGDIVRRFETIPNSGQRSWTYCARVIFDNAESDYVIMDDDIKGFYELGPDHKSKRIDTLAPVWESLAFARQSFPHLALFSISFKPNQRFATHQYKLNKFCTCFTWINKPLLVARGIEYDRTLSAMADYDLTINCIRRGLPTAVDYRFSYDHKMNPKTSNIRRSEERSFVICKRLRERYGANVISEIQYVKEHGLYRPKTRWSRINPFVMATLKNYPPASVALAKRVVAHNPHEAAK